MAVLTREDNEAVAVYGRTHTPEQTETYRAELYKARIGALGFFAGLPKYALIGFAVWIALLETADKLPKLALTLPQFEATRAQFDAQKLQPELLRAQITAAVNEALASKYKADTAKAQLEAAQSEAKAAAFKPAASAAQAMKIEAEAVAAASPSFDFQIVGRMEAALDLLDPNHPLLIRHGLIDPTLRLADLVPTLEDYKQKVAHDARDAQAAAEKKQAADAAAKKAAEEAAAAQAAKEARGKELQTAKDSALMAMKECADKRRSGELKGYVASALCSNPRVVGAWRSVGYEHMDFIIAFAQERIEEYQKVDLGVKTADQAQTAINEWLAKNVPADIADPVSE